MADIQLASTPAVEDAEVFLSASDDEVVQQAITPELLSALVKQVEFYFSDANLPTDKKLLKQIRKDAEGFVPVKLFANFRKVRALSKDVSIITEALRGATLLQLSQDCKRVRRIIPVPEYDISDIQRRTIVVENIPGNPSPTIESVTDMFRLYGRVKLVRICSRESKGKLPSWLTGSCQNMGGQQHAYVEFEDEEGAILAAAALAQENDAPDGVVQVRRLLACIAEQRERRSVNGAGSSFGGSSVGCSRKGSRDVSPLGSRHANSRRNSGGGAPYGSYSCGGSTWTSSGGGAPPSDPYHQSYHYHSYGGAFDHGGGSRRGSGGGAGASPTVPHLPPPPPPPPPPRRSCDSAPPSELLPAAPAVAPAPPGSGRSLNIYRPPAKRLSDGYNSGFQTPAMAVAAPLVTPLQRSVCGSFGSSSFGTNGSTAPVSAASTPTGAPSSPSPMMTAMPSAFISVTANSPPISTRGMSSGGGKPPVHPPSMLLGQGAVVAPTAAVAAKLLPSESPVATVPINSLAEAIAHVQAERRASEAGAKTAVAPPLAPTADAAPAVSVPAATVPSVSATSAAAAAVAAAHRPGPTAPKYCLDLAAGLQSRGPRFVSSVEGSQYADAGPSPTQTACNKAIVAVTATAAPAPSALPRGTQAQMVANVEDFINNILARPAARPVAVPSSAAAAASAAATAATNGAPQQQRKASLGAATAGAPASTPRSLSLSSAQPQPVADAAAAVAGILASALRRPSSNPVAVAATTASVACDIVPPAKPVAAIVDTVSTDLKPAAVAQTAAALRPTVYITAIAEHETVAGAPDLSLEHAVTVTVHTHAGAGFEKPKPQVVVPEPEVLACSSSSVTSSPRESSPIARYTPSGYASSAAANNYNNKPKNVKNSSTGCAGRGAQPGAKRLSRREYAQWAAATPGFRAEAAMKYAASGSPVVSAGLARSSGGGAGQGASASPAALASISDGGMFGSTTTSMGSSHAGAIWHVARGPDGSKGFGGRARSLLA